MRPQTAPVIRLLGILTLSLSTARYAATGTQEPPSVKRAAQAILDESGTSGERRNYILEHLERGDLQSAIAAWSESQGIRTDPELNATVLTEALNAEFNISKYGLRITRHELETATAATVPIFLSSIAGPDDSGPSYYEFFETLMRDTLGISGASGAPPGLSRKEYGRLKLDCTPVPGQVKIDGVSAGSSDYVYAVLVGRHKVRGASSGYNDCRQVAQVNWRQLTRLPCKLTKPH